MAGIFGATTHRSCPGRGSHPSDVPDRCTRLLEGLVGERAGEEKMRVLLQVLLMFGVQASVPTHDPKEVLLLVETLRRTWCATFANTSLTSGQASEEVLSGCCKGLVVPSPYRNGKTLMKSDQFPDWARSTSRRRSASSRLIKVRSSSFSIFAILPSSAVMRAVTP